MPDYYLVLTGLRASPTSSYGSTRPWVICRVYLFNTVVLLDTLRKGSVKIGVATSIKQALWDMCEIYPQSHSELLSLTDAQRAQLAHFAPSDADGSNLIAATADLFVDDAFAEEVDAYVQAERRRERNEAVREATA